MKDKNAIPLRYRIPLIFAGTLVAFGMLLTPWGEDLSRLAYDYQFGIRGPLGTPDEMVIVGIDEESFGQLDLAWPWPREVHAELVDQLFAAGAKVVAFDLLFSEPSDDPEQDQIFADAISRHKNVVLVSDIGQFFNEELGFSQLMISEPEPIRDLVKGELKIGYDNVELDPDGRIRGIALTQEGEKAFSLKTAETFLGKPIDLASFNTNNDSRTPVRVNFLGPRDIVRRVSYYQALDPETNLPPRIFKDKMVFIGRVISSQVDADNPAVDHFAVPFTRIEGGLMPGVEVHAHTTFNILTNSFIVQVPRNLVYTLAAILGVVGGMCFLSFRLLTATLLYGALVGLIGFASIYLFATEFRDIAPVQLLFPLTICYALAPFSHYWVQRKQKAFIKRAFSTYLAPSLVEQMLNEPDKLELGGEELEGSVMFLDLAGFTNLSERLPVKELLELVNRNLGAFAEIILKWDGMIDKYIGDCIMAVWGVPLPQPDHAKRACSAMLEIREAAIRLAAEEFERTGEDLSVRIGLNSGRMYAGNVGGGQQFNYTVLGNEVNLAARLEGINKYYGTKLIISESTVAKVGDAFELRELDMIRVVGQQKPVKIYELLAHQGQLPEERRPLLDAFTEGCQRYQELQWSEAIAAFEQCLVIDPNDGPSATYLERCRDYLELPPPDNWDGVYQMRSK